MARVSIETIEAAVRETEAAERLLEGIPPPANENLAQAASDSGTNSASVSPAAEARPEVVMRPGPIGPIMPKPANAADLENAGRLIIGKIHQSYREILVDVAAQHSIPLWQLICGIINRQGEGGHLTDFILDPDWQGLFMPVATEMLMAVCQSCGNKYKPKRQGQRFCCNGCARKAMGGAPYTTAHTQECPISVAV